MMISTLSASFFDVFNDDTVDFFDAFNENFFVLILLQIRQELSVIQNFVQLAKIHRARDELVNQDILRFALREGVSLNTVLWYAIRTIRSSMYSGFTSFQNK